MQRTDVILANVNDEAWVSLLLDCNLAAFLFRSDLNTGLIDLDLLFIKIRRDFDHGRITIRNAFQCVCYILLDVLYTFLDVLVHCRHIYVLIYDYCDFGWRWELAGVDRAHRMLDAQPTYLRMRCLALHHHDLFAGWDACR